MSWLLLVLAAAVMAWLVLKARTPRAVGAAPLGAATPSDRDATADDLQQFMAPFGATMESSRRPLMRINLHAMDKDDPLISKVGGSPWWPRGTAWPLDSRQRPLALLAQLDFMQLPAPMPGYPERGLLQIFIASDDFYGANIEDMMTMDGLARQQNFRLVYWPAFDARRASSECEPAPASDEMHGLPHDPASPRRMVFVPDTETLSIGDHRLDALCGGSWYAAIEAFAARQGISEDSLADAMVDKHDGSGHKLGGYPHFTQTDPRVDGDWELLLQIDTDDQIMWGDAGVANFFISPKALARADFSRVAYNWDCC